MRFSKNRQVGFIKKYSSITNLVSNRQIKHQNDENESFSKFQQQFSSFHYIYPQKDTQNQFSLFEYNKSSKSTKFKVKNNFQLNVRDNKQQYFLRGRQEEQEDQFKCHKILQQQQAGQLRQTNNKFIRQNNYKSQQIKNNFSTVGTYVNKVNETNNININNKHVIYQGRKQTKYQDETYVNQNCNKQNKEGSQNYGQVRKEAGKLRLKYNQSMLNQMNRKKPDRMEKEEQVYSLTNYYEQRQGRLTRIKSQQNVMRHNNNFHFNDLLNRPNQSINFIETVNLKKYRNLPPNTPLIDRKKIKTKMMQLSQSSVIQSQPSFLQQRIRQFRRRKQQLQEKKRQLEELKRKSRHLTEQTRSDYDSAVLGINQIKKRNHFSQKQELILLLKKKIQNQNLEESSSSSQEQPQLPPSQNSSSQNHQSSPNKQPKYSDQKGGQFHSQSQEHELDYQLIQDQIQTKDLKYQRIEREGLRNSTINQYPNLTNDGIPCCDTKKNSHSLNTVNQIQKIKQLLEIQELKQTYQLQGIHVAKGGITFDIDTKNFIYPVENQGYQGKLVQSTIKNPTITSELHKQTSNGNSVNQKSKRSSKKIINSKQELKRRRQLAKNYDKHARNKLFG